jgi:HK97 gp10 family phage protein
VAVNDVLGVEETLAALGEFPKATGRNTLRRALLKAAEPVAIAARAYAPDDPKTAPPDLKRSIAVATQLTRRAKRSGPKKNEVEVYVGPTRQVGRAVLNYAATVEFGTFRAAPHPYMRPAWERTKGLVMTVFARELTVEYEKAAARLSRKFFKLR